MFANFFDRVTLSAFSIEVKGRAAFSCCVGEEPTVLKLATLLVCNSRSCQKISVIWGLNDAQRTYLQMLKIWKQWENAFGNIWDKTEGRGGGITINNHDCVSLITSEYPVSYYLRRTMTSYFYCEGNVSWNFFLLWREWEGELSFQSENWVGEDEEKKIEKKVNSEIFFKLTKLSTALHWMHFLNRTLCRMSMLTRWVMKTLANCFIIRVSLS